MQTGTARKKTLGVANPGGSQHDFELISSFRGQFRILSHPDSMRVLSTLGSGWFVNSDVRTLLGCHRQTSWVRLSRLCQAGLVEKRGYSYRVSSSAWSLIGAISRALAGLVSNEEISEDPEISSMLEIASEGIDLLYSKGRLDQARYAKVKNVLKGLS